MAQDAQHFVAVEILAALVSQGVLGQAEGLDRLAS